jgi:hypothetical protein
LLRDYPRLNTTELTVTGNTALGQYLRLLIRKSSRDTIEATIGRENRQNGFLILQYLVSTYGSTTIIDASNARDKLESTSWNDRDTIDSFTHRFMLRLSNYNESIYASSNNNTQPYEPDQITIFYLKLLVTTMPTDHHLYREAQAMYTQGERKLVRQGRLQTNTTEVQRELQMIELTINANTYDNRPTERPSNREHYTRQKTVHTKPPHAANVALQSSKYKKIKCWGCGHGHHLRNCPTTSEKEQQRWWEEHRNRQPP